MTKIIELAEKVALMDLKLDQINRQTDENVSNQGRLLKELHELTAAIRVMTEKQVHVKETADRMWGEHTDLSRRVRELESFKDVSFPVIEGVRDLNKRIIGMVMAALLAAVIAPFATATYILKQLPETTVVRHEQAIPPRDPK